MRNSEPLPTILLVDILKEEFLQPLELSQHKLAVEMRVSPKRVSEVVNGMRSNTADTTMRLSRFFGNSARFRVNLQTAYDLEVAEREI